jgi:hypothetical protein
MMIEARRGLLDALDALGTHRDSVILVGAQAIYLHTKGLASPVAEFTRDVDLAFQPELLSDSPLLEDCLKTAGFVPGDPSMPGRWISPRGTPADFMIPNKLLGNNRRSAGVEPHAKNTARNTKGIEGCLIDKSLHKISSLDKSDEREFEIYVAGPAALLIAKTVKVVERLEGGGKVENKDSHDIYRLLAAVPLVELVTGIRKLCENDLSEGITRKALEQFSMAFASSSEAPGSKSAGEAERGIGDPEGVAISSSILAQELLTNLKN